MSLIRLLENTTPAIAEFDHWFDRSGIRKNTVAYVEQHSPTSPIRLKAIQNLRGAIKTGNARTILAKLIEIADKHRLAVELEADQTTPSSHWLEDWYQRLGFVHTGQDGRYGPHMHREPK